MWKLVSKINPWLYGGLLLGSGPVAWYVSGEYGWPAAWSSLLVIVLFSTLSAVRGPMSAAGFTTTVGAVTAAVAAAVAQPISNEPWTAVLASVTIATLATVSCIIHASHSEMKTELAELQEKLTDRLRMIYDLQRQAAESRSTDRAANASPLNDSDTLNLHTAGHAAGDSSAASGDKINYPLLLLSLQDMARSIASNLDMDSLVATIIRTSANLLKCADCQVYVWNAAIGRLIAVSPANPSKETPKHVARPDHGVTKWVLQNRQIITREDLEKDYSLRALLDEEPTPPDAVIPLTVGGELLGLIVLHGLPAGSQHVGRLLPIFANVCSLGVKNAQLFQRIDEMARRDGLTGLWNRATFNESLDRLTRQAQDWRRPLCVIMSDVDHFKKFNDTYGHQAGDHVLREVAKLWKAALPDSTLAARYGGEEFIAILPETNLSRARELAEALRSELQSFPLIFEGQELHVTASFGVAELGSTVKEPAELVRIADEALYAAKKSGRNRVCVPDRTPACCSDTQHAHQPVAAR